MRILYIEDNELNRVVFAALLAKVADVVCVSSGSEALELLVNAQFDIVVIDLNLNDPEIDGFEVMRTLTQNGFKKQNSTRFYALTAYAHENWEKKCMDAGFDHYFTKPVDPSEILEKDNELK
ncbi:response regulator [Litoribacter ruber]|uniref:Response regulator n=1 Tax=Litoribacter ruber TaxID=702568 RepID=A0AAP2CI95_9BACT|nr:MULTISPECIES: response regulator [Litoribacter]MBS9525243.1 response regulator [Litoribacter alkaliphilus]MBT0811729.1 response regulator [Litoribacter ruber]